MTQKNDSIVPLHPRHIVQMAEIERLCFSDPWSEETLREELDNDLSRYFVREQNGRVLGYVGTRLVLDEIDITNVAVRPECRRCGVGSALLSALLDFAQERRAELITLEVRVSNRPAQALYKAFGFELCGCRRGYYDNPPEDALLMLRKLQPPNERND